MAPRQAPHVPSVLDICPNLRRPCRRAAVEIRRLVQRLTLAFPDAAFLAREPAAADWIDTTPFDHALADVISSARGISIAIAALDDPL